VAAASSSSIPESPRAFCVRARTDFRSHSHVFVRCHRYRTLSRWNLRQNERKTARQDITVGRSSNVKQSDAYSRADALDERRCDYRSPATTDSVVLIGKTVGIFGSSMARTSGLRGPRPPLHTTRRWRAVTSALPTDVVLQNSVGKHCVRAINRFLRLLSWWIFVSISPIWR